jgi:hypothetical protein
MTEADKFDLPHGVCLGGTQAQMVVNRAVEALLLYTLNANGADIIAQWTRASKGIDVSK